MRLLAHQYSGDAPFPGHINKVMSLAWVPWSLSCFLTGLRDGRLGGFFMAGGFLGLSLLGGEVQAPFYLGLWYGAWWLLTLGREIYHGRWKGARVVLQTIGILLIPVISLTVGWSTTQHSLRYLGGNTPVGHAEATSAAQNWFFATQFYFPPEEILSYLTTIQFFGGPHVYWGRDGQPIALRLSDDYMGLLPLGLALVGAMVCWRAWIPRLFVFMGLGSLLASFGREGGLYALLYQLPTMKSQRNPHRWSYFVSLAVCVLAAYGVDWLCRRWAQSVSEPEERLKRAREGLWILGLGGVGLALLSAIGWAIPEALAALAYGAAEVDSPRGILWVERTRMMMASLTRTGVFLALSATAMGWLFHTHEGPRDARRFARRAWVFLFLVLVLDLGLNARRYFQSYPWKRYYNDNPIANFFRKDPDLFRVKTFGAQQNPLLNQLVSQVLPYHRVGVVDPPAVSRLPKEYATFLHHLESHYLRSDRYMDLFNIKYVLGPATFSDPHVSLELLGRLGEEASGALYLYRRPHFMPRAWLVPSARVMSAEDDKALLATLIHPDFAFRDEVILTQPPRLVPSLQGPIRNIPDKKKSKKGSTMSTSPPIRSVRVIRQEDNAMEMETASTVPMILVMSELWDPDWKAWVDGQRTPILKANFLMRAVELTAGSHKVLLEYRPSTESEQISRISLLLFAFIGISWTLMRLRFLKGGKRL